MDKEKKFVVFALDELRYALYLSCVDKVVQMVEITPLPKAPEIIAGIINVNGDIVPVIDIRQRFRLPARGINPDDLMIIAGTPKRRLAVVVDTVYGVMEYPEENPEIPGRTVPGVGYVEGVMKLPDGLVLIHNLEKFLSLEEEKILDRTVKLRRQST